MSEPARRPKGAFAPSSRRSSALAVIAIAIVLLADVALIAWAVAERNGADAGQTPGSIPTFGTPAPETPAPEAPDSEALEDAISANSAPEDALPEAFGGLEAPAPRLLAAASDTVAWRATRGDCTDGGAVLERTEDGGATWQDVTPRRFDVAEIVAIDATTDPSIATIVFADAECAVAAVRTFSQGVGWEAHDAALDTVPHLGPDGLVVSGAEVAAPCEEPISVAGGGETSVVLCEGVVFESADGATWAEREVPGVLAAAAFDGGHVISVWGAEGCSGLALESLGAPIDGAESRVLGCITDLDPRGSLTLAVTPSVAWIWSGDAVRTSALSASGV